MILFIPWKRNDARGAAKRSRSQSSMLETIADATNRTVRRVRPIGTKRGMSGTSSALRLESSRLLRKRAGDAESAKRPQSLASVDPIMTASIHRARRVRETIPTVLGILRLGNEIRMDELARSGRSIDFVRRVTRRCWSVKGINARSATRRSAERHTSIMIMTLAKCAGSCAVSVIRLWRPLIEKAIWSTHSITCEPLVLGCTVLHEGAGG